MSPSPSTPLVALNEANSTADAKNVASVNELRNFYSTMTQERHVIYQGCRTMQASTGIGTWMMVSRHINDIVLTPSTSYFPASNCVYLDPADWGFGGTRSMWMQSTLLTSSTYTGTTALTMSFSAAGSFSFAASGSFTTIAGLGTVLGTANFGVVGASTNQTIQTTLTTPTTAGFYTVSFANNVALTATGQLSLEVLVWAWDQ